MKIVQPLLGKSLLVRDYEPEDLSFCVGMWFDPENGRFLSDPTAEFVDEKFQRALDGMQDSRYGYYLVAQRRDELVGTCCIFPDKALNVFDIGYCIHKNFWRQGLGTELVELLVQWIREQGGSAVTAEAATENIGSCKLLEKCGFQVAKHSSFRKYHMDVSFESVIYEKRL